MKRNKIYLSAACFLLAVLVITSINSCKKIDLERITNIQTKPVEIENSIATAKGEIVDVSDKSHQNYGFCWSEQANPDLTANVISFGAISEAKHFSYEFKSLELNKTYYICAFIYDGDDILYGDVVSFMITAYGITVTTNNDVIVQTSNSATISGSIQGVGSINIAEYGHVWDTIMNPDISSNRTTYTNLSNDTAFESDMTGLLSLKKYYVRSYAKIDNSTVIYGDTVSFSISDLSVTTDSIIITGSSTINIVGIINSLGFSAVSDHGHCWSTNPGPTINDNTSALGPATQTGFYVSNLSNLDTNTTYYIRAYATNASITTYGNERTFVIQAFDVSSDGVKLISDDEAEGDGTLSIGSYEIDNHGHCWSSTNYPPTVNDSKASLGPSSSNTGFVSNLTNLMPNTTYYVRAYATEGSTTKYGKVDTLVVKNFWTQISDFGGSPRNDAIALSMGTKAYLGLGVEIYQKNDFWEYDSVSGAWTQKANYNDSVVGAVGFVIGGKAYLGTGLGNNFFSKSLNVYDPSTNLWSSKANYGGDSVSGAVAFAIGNLGYVGTGFDGGAFKNDFWEYNPNTDSWTQKADFSGTARSDAVGYGINGKGYVCGGYDGTNYNNDMYEYDPSSNSWTSKANLGGSGRSDAVGFEINGLAYIGLGWDGSAYLTDLWAYDPQTNAWVQKSDFAGAARWKAVGFSLGDKAYVGTGLTTNNQKDFWVYNPNNY